jgi:putative inorganic carbon (hco3(-)) transporter
MKGKLGPEHWLYAAFIVLIPFQSLLSTPFAGVELKLADLAFLLLAIVWLVNVLSRRRPVRLNWFHLLLGAYLLSVTLSTVTAVDPSRSGVRLVGKLYLGLIAFLSFEIVDSMDSLRVASFAWLSASCIVLFLGLIGIAGFYLGISDPTVNLVIHPVYGSLPAGNYPRIEGLFEYPAMFCNFLGITWMLAIACLLNGWVKDRYVWIFGGMLLTVNAFTLTPGLGGIFLSTGILLWRLRAPGIYFGGRTYLISGVMIAVLFLAGASVTLFSYDSGALNSPLSAGEISASHRVKAWKSAFQTFLQFPLLGKGPGVPVAEAMYRDPNGYNQILTDAHNTYLSVLAETGLTGFLTFFALVSWVIMRLFAQGNAALRWVKLCLLLALADSLFYQGFTGSYEDARHLWVVIGLASAAGKRGIFLLDLDAEDQTQTHLGQRNGSVKII